MTLETP